MRMFQSEMRLSKELSRILTSPEEKMKVEERRALEDEEDFVVYLPSEVEVNEGGFSFIKIRDGSEILLQI
jgi:hypothetical protein